MEGLELVARDSLTRLGSRFSDKHEEVVQEPEAALAYYADVINKDEDERNWSIPYLRRQLELKSCHHLFRRYQMRVQHALFVELLLLNLIVNGIILCAAASGFLHQINQENTSTWCRIFTIVSNFVLLSTALIRERWFINSSTLRASAALGTLFTMIVAEMGPTAIFANKRQEHQEISTFYIVLTSAVLLPFSRKVYAASAASVVIAVDLVLTALKWQCEYQRRAMHLCREGFYLLVALGAGLWVRHLMEIRGRRSFLDRRECIESKMNIENEKDREERLLQSVLPQHLAEEFREDLRDLIWKVVENKGPVMNVCSLGQRKPFQKLYVERHTNVSILYADIVNSMLLCASLQVADLVDTLDDLFGRFDRAAEINNCMRIKLLGDCYYCVAGLPVLQPRRRQVLNLCHHADDCVRTGILMILIIREIREKRHVDVDMRIGVHSGRVLGGLLGLKKWQYDVWSRDVTIASHMEQAGVPGHIHITKETKDLLCEDYGPILPGDGQLRDHYLAQEGITTFLIAPGIKNITRSEMEIINFRRPSFSVDDEWGITPESRLVGNSRVSRNSHSFNIVPQRRRAVLDYSLLDFQDMVKKVNNKMETAIDKMALGKKDQWCSSEGVHPLFLIFHDWRNLGWPYLLQPDPLFKYYLLCSLLLFVSIFTLQLTTLNTSEKPVGVLSNHTNTTISNDDKNFIAVWTIHGITFLVILSICFISWIGYLSFLLKGDDDIQETTMYHSRFLQLSRSVWRATSMRTILWSVISFMIVGCALLGFHMSKQSSAALERDMYKDNSYCEPDQWLHTACLTLALASTSVFIRVHYLLKLIINCVGLVLFCIFPSTSGIQHPSEENHQCFYLGLVVLILHMLDRQVEYVCRLDFVWKWRLKKEQNESMTVDLVNRMLLNNILPQHVKQFYLNERKFLPYEAPYHEECSSVAILFASIPNFANFYCEDELNEAGRRCIQLLNEIVCDFDLLLFKKQYCRIEKMKTIGSTYMAACGLHKYEDENLLKDDERSEVEQVRRYRNVVTLAFFAKDMMATLRQLNRDALQELQLRIGLAVGRVMAGVVGSMRPQFDIWGDAVNVASRMDSTGIPGRIQVTEEVADIIKASNSFEVESRGQIYVKGKGELTTYFLRTEYDELSYEQTNL